MELLGLAIDDLPLPVVNFLNVIGVPWPYVNEDTVSEFSSLVRRFGQAVETTHQDAARSIAGATSVTVPMMVRRAAMRARSR